MPAMTPISSPYTMRDLVPKEQGNLNISSIINFDYFLPMPAIVRLRRRGRPLNLGNFPNLLALRF
jgi:hypothetical protein